MIDRIIEFSAHNKFLVLLLTAVALGGAAYSMRHIPLDAIPDLSDTQVIVYSRWDRSPDIIEDQVTYPIITSLLGAPGVRAIRGFSDFGFSYVYIIFEDGTDLYWARSRTLEYLNKILPLLPDGVKTEMGPDATGLGWVYQYALVDRSGRHDLAQLRSFQDWYLRFWLQSVPGVAEVASIGGFQKQYQVNLDPGALLAHGIPIQKVIEAIRQGNDDVGGRLVEFGGAEYMVRGRGYSRSVQDLEAIVVKRDEGGTPLRVRDLGRVAVGPDIRRGVVELDGQGETVGGIVVMRHGENALAVIDRVKARLEEVRPSLPEGMEIVTTYDRSDLILRAISTLRHDLILEMIIVSVVILIFLWHIPSAAIPIVTIPISVALAFIPMYLLGINSNIMSLAGIAISIGVLVDGAIVEVENAYRKIQIWQEQGRPVDFHTIRLEALKEVGPSVFFSLLVIAVAFLPVFALVDQGGRLFKPLAWTKNLTMAIAAILAITLDPALRMMFARIEPFRFKPRWMARLATGVAVGRYVPEERHPISRALFKVYEPACRFVLRRPWATIAVAAALVLATIPAYRALGSEFMPTLDEGDLLYMPITLPGISVTAASQLLQTMDRMIMEVPEVERVFGKIGRAETPTDPAPFSMVETTILLKPHEQWRRVPRFYSGWPEWLQAPLRPIWYDRITREDLVAELDAKLRFPGVTNAWVMPIKNRIDMTHTGIRTPIGIKIFGPDLREIERLGARIEAVVKPIPGTRSVFAERTAGGYYLDFELRRDDLARYGLSVQEAQRVIQSAIGGETITRTVEGRERYSVNVRYAREAREDLDRLGRVLVPLMDGAQVPLAQIADIRTTTGPAMIRDENGMLAGYVYVDLDGRDVGGYVREARELVAEAVPLSPGYSVQWSGQYENMQRQNERMKVVVPIALGLIVVLLYLNTRSAFKTGLVMLAVLFSMIGAVWLLYVLGYHMSTAVLVGIIALLGLDAETGVFMLLFLDLSYGDAVRRGRMSTKEDLREAIVHGAVKRIRPKLMTVAAAMMGLMPIMWSLGTGSDVMKRIAAPMVGGLVTSFILELLVYPPLYEMWKWHTEVKHGKAAVPMGGHPRAVAPAAP
ncbi:MAG TPA: CusA/CzcA family heavy metal efflux RND transporter [Candidatus Polarisedimenticolia bacterium]|nr:CusA/CzcA family heavy metal efflux RND transporter [Candidatus Polarisedimenticolia bacterium]